jgi:omega-6 fatty acid desaturase (delta-12 desaturase)
MSKHRDYSKSGKMERKDEKELMSRINAFCVADDRKATIELVATLALCGGLFSAMIYGITGGKWIYFLLLPLTAVLFTRLFTIQHDCGHGAYFSSRCVNDAVGNALSILTLTPYHYWKKTHAAHHACSGDLDRRGTGDVDVLTVAEYKALTPFKKAWYRLYRNPAFMVIMGPLLIYGFKFRLPLDNPYHSVKSWTGIMLTNLGIFLTIAALVHFFGLDAFLLVYLPVSWTAAAIGVTGFYIQHQYEETYWSRNGEWSHFDAALQGSSYFEFPRILNWLVNNINLHHIHHLNGRVPSYRLRECLMQIPELRAVTKRTLSDIPACFRLALWDDESGKMVGFN